MGLVLRVVLVAGGLFFGGAAFAVDSGINDSLGTGASSVGSTFPSDTMATSSSSSSLPMGSSGGGITFPSGLTDLDTVGGNSSNATPPALTDTLNSQ